MALLVLHDLTKVFSGDVTAVDRVRLRVGTGELLAVVGPSGCGKTTMLRMIAGLDSPTSGSIEIDGRDVTSLPPRGRGIAMVLQRPALYPHWRVRKNISFGLRMRKIDRAEIDRRVDRIAALLDIEPLLGRRPNELSGGQQRRVALARALVAEAPCLLLDEPLSHLDGDARRQLRDQIASLHRQLHATTIYVTHDQEEAMAVADRLAVMAHGAIQQCAAPQTVYDRPANRFVAGAIGAAAMNFCPGRLVADGDKDGLRFDGGMGSIAVPALVVRQFSAWQHAEVVLGFRPESVRPATERSAAAEHLEITAKVTFNRPLGAFIEVHLTVGGGSDIVARLDRRHEADISAAQRFAIEWNDVHVFAPGEFGENLLHAGD